MWLASPGMPSRPGITVRSLALFMTVISAPGIVLGTRGTVTKPTWLLPSGTVACGKYKDLPSTFHMCLNPNAEPFGKSARRRDH